MIANGLPGDPTLPPGVTMRDIDPPERRDDDDEGAFWEQWWKYTPRDEYEPDRD